MGGQPDKGKHDQQDDFDGGPSAPENHIEEEEENTDAAEEAAIPDSDLAEGILSGKPDATQEVEEEKRQTD